MLACWRVEPLHTETLLHDPLPVQPPARVAALPRSSLRLAFKPHLSLPQPALDVTVFFLFLLKSLVKIQPPRPTTQEPLLIRWDSPIKGMFFPLI